MFKPRIKLRTEVKGDLHYRFLQTAPHAVSRILSQYLIDKSLMADLRRTISKMDGDLSKLTDQNVIERAKVLFAQRALEVEKDLCDKTDLENKKYFSFMKLYTDDCAVVAKALNLNVEQILGLSSLESDFGQSYFAINGGNNFFGLHATSSHTYPFQTGVRHARKAPAVMEATFKSFADCANAFKTSKGSFVAGMIKYDEFAQKLQDKGFGIGDNGPLADYVPNLVERINNIAERMKCR